MTERTKVMWLIKGLGVGGAEQLLVNSLPHLDRDRFSYEIAYILPWKTALVDKFVQQDIPVHCLNGSSLPDPRVIFRLSRLLKERKVQILDSHLPYPGVVGRAAARMAGVRPILYTEHSLAVQRRFSNFRYIAFMSNILTYPMNDLILTVSRDTYKDVQRFNWWRTPTQVVYNGIDLVSLEPGHGDVAATRRDLGIPEDHKVVGHVANLVSKKRQEDLLRAARLVIDQYPTVTFVLVGRGVLMDRLKELARELGIQDNVIFAGFVDDLKQTMEAFDIFALSSLYEGLPTVVIEAMAMGKPAVATAVGGTPEIITDGSDGFLTRPKDPAEMAQRLLQLLQDDQQREIMGQRARQRMLEKFDIRRRVREVEEIYLNTSQRAVALAK